ncbi:MAG: hypothetical protein K8F58_09320, partial [Bauldia sp.]|nr:hypothetical protein [Bauldia sp.]
MVSTTIPHIPVRGAATATPTAIRSHAIGPAILYGKRHMAAHAPKNGAFAAHFTGSAPLSSA